MTIHTTPGRMHEAEDMTADAVLAGRLLRALEDRPRWTYYAENLPAAREAGYDDGPAEGV